MNQRKGLFNQLRSSAALDSPFLTHICHCAILNRLFLSGQTARQLLEMIYRKDGIFKMKEMPKQGTYLFLVIVGFVCGIIWGALAFGPYNKMKEAIAAENAEEAWMYAGKVKKWIIIGIIINVIIFFAGAMR